MGETAFGRRPRDTSAVRAFPGRSKKWKIEIKLISLTSNEKSIGIGRRREDWLNLPDNHVFIAVGEIDLFTWTFFFPLLPRRNSEAWAELKNSHGLFAGTRLKTSTGFCLRAVNRPIFRGRTTGTFGVRGVGGTWANYFRHFSSPRRRDWDISSFQD